MTVGSDDGNKLPLRIESPIVVGNIKVDMMGYRNLGYPLKHDQVQLENR